MNVGCKSAVGRLALVTALLLVVAGAFTASARAASTSASPQPAASAQPKIILRQGCEVNPDNLNPFVGYETTSYTIWDLNYDSLATYDKVNLEPRPCLAVSWSSLPTRRSGRFTFATASSGRTACRSPPRRRLHLQLHHQEQDGRLHAATPPASSRPWRSTTYTVEVHVRGRRPTCSPTGVPILPEHIWSKVSPQGRRATTYPNKPPIIGTGPFESSEWNKATTSSMVANKRLLGRQAARSTRSSSRLPNADTMAEDLKTGDPRLALRHPGGQFKHARERYPALRAP